MSDGWWPFAPREVLTDAQGYYRLEGLSLDSHSLEVHWEGAALGTQGWVHVRPGETTRKDFTLQVWGTGLLEGVVRTPRGLPPTEPLTVTVTSYPLSHVRASLDSTGRFRLVLPAREYRLELASNPDRLSPEQVVPRVRVEEGQRTRLELTWPEADGHER